MIRFHNMDYADEADLRQKLNTYSVPNLLGEDYSRPLSTNPSLVRPSRGWPRKKADIVDVWVEYVLRVGRVVEIPNDFESLKAAVIREVMEYDGCWDGKNEWLQRLGLSAPPPELVLEDAVLNVSSELLPMEDRSDARKVQAFINSHLPDGVSLTLEGVFQD